MINKKIELFKQIAIDTWDRFIFSKQVNIKYSETTITENLLFKLHQHQIINKNNDIQIYEATDEKKNGNDLEIFLEIKPNKYLFLVVQAKKIHIATQKYKNISHKVGNTSQYQIDLLDNYAKLNHAIPLYLMYNYAPTFNKKNKKDYGCSLVCSNYIKNNYYSNIKNWKIPSFNDLHHNKAGICQALPLYFLGIPKYFEKFIQQVCNSKYKIFKGNEIIYEKYWKSIDENDECTLKDSTEKKLIDNLDVFNPKYRIVIRNYIDMRKLK